MPRKSLILYVVEAVVGETLLTLKIQNERPEFILADLSYIFASPHGSEKVLEVTDAVSDDGDGIGAFAFGSSAELIPRDKVIECC